MNLTIPAMLERYQSQIVMVRATIYQLREQALDQNNNNAWIHILSEQELAPYLDALAECDPATKPLYGIPFAIKDNIDLAGIPTTAACPEFEYTPDKHAYVVQKLIDAGAIPLGKTNLDQFATGLVGTRSPWGECHNSFNPDYVSGGSSAGSAVSVALGQVSFSLGTDTAGSGRVPAAFNNLVGVKPTIGLLSASGVVPACRTIDTISIFALTTNDAANVLSIAADYDAKDAYARPNKFGNSIRQFGDAKGTFKFGVPKMLAPGQDKETTDLFYQAVERFEQLGGKKVEIDFGPFLTAARLLYEGPWVSERWAATEKVWKKNPEAMLPVIIDIIGQAQDQSAVDAFKAQYKLADLKRKCDQLIEGLDFVVTPTTVSHYTRDQVRLDPIGKNSNLGTYTNFMNLLDYSAVAVPVGFTEDTSLPWGITLFSHAFEDMKLLSYAKALHEQKPFKLGNTGTILKPEPKEKLTAPDSVDVVVCGAHLQGQPLNWQLTERGGELVETTTSSDQYKLYALSDGKRPGMIRAGKGGNAIEVEVWRIPMHELGSFTAAIPAPLGIGKVELADGRWLVGFICDSYGIVDATDITDLGGWRAWLAQKDKATEPAPVTA